MHLSHRTIGTSIAALFMVSAWTLDAGAGQWRYVEETDVMSDELKQFIYGVPLQAEGTSGSVYLRIGCYKGGTDMGVTMSWGAQLEPLYPDSEIHMAAVSTRFDKGNPVTLGWAASRTFDFTYAPNLAAGAIAQIGEGVLGALIPWRDTANTTWNAKQLHFSLLASDRAVFRSSSLRGPAITLVFDMEGYREEAVKLNAGCNPPGIDDFVAASPKKSSPTPPAAVPASPGSRDLFNKTWFEASGLFHDAVLSAKPEGEYPLASDATIEAVRMYWLDKAFVVRVQSPEWRSSGLYLYFLTDGNRTVWLDGTVGPIFAFLEGSTLTLTPITAAEYLRFFTFFVRGEEGPFLIVESAEDRYLPGGGAPATSEMAAMRNRLRAAACEVTSDAAECEGTVYYASALFEASFAMTPDGRVTMLSGDAVTPDLPATVDAPLR